MKLFQRSSISWCLISVLIILFSITSSKGALAQDISKFSGDHESYPSELRDVVKDQLKEEDEQAFEDFTDYWNSDTLSFSPEHKDLIIVLSEYLFKKTSVNTDHFITFIKVLLLYKNQDKFYSEFEAWTKGLENYAANESISINRLSQFIKNSYALFTNNTIAINPAYNWKASNSNFTFFFDEIPSIRFTETDIICTNQKDSIVILKTQGTYYPFEDKWIGQGGKVTWERSLFPADEIFAELSNYTIDLTRNEYQADSVWFTNKDYFDVPSLGKLKDKVVRSTKPENVVFPEFYTYTQRHKIKDLFENVDFDGGYYMMGSQFIGNGTKENPAIIEIRRNNDEFLKVESRSYIFRRQNIISNYARVRFKLGTDSLFHTGLNFTYNDEMRLVTISPTDFLTTQSPIQSSYHNFSIKFNQLQWYLDRNEITFGAPIGSSLGRASFESNNYFNEEEFDKLMGRDEQHPLFSIANFTNKIQSKIFMVEDFSRFVRKPLEQTRIVIMGLAMQGFVFYEFETGEVQALPKLYDALRARGQFIDYDVLKFRSTSEGEPNVTLDLITLEMAIRGVENVSVSDSQNVFIYPARKQLILKKNRNFAFDGVVRAGLFTFFGKDFNFDYEQFSLELSSIDSLNLDYQTDDYDSYGRRVLEKVTSTLENITGEILIDKANNKSGLQMNEEYPIFKSTKNSFVYYDDPSIHNGVYPRDSFYFEIFPFTFYNINNFELSDMNFTGVLYSADIFAPIEDTLILRPDNSLGFRRNTETAGIAVYQGRGRFFNRIDLSNKGLRGEGRVDYITSSTSSDDIYFFPDSMRTKSTEFAIARRDAGIQYPNLVGNEHIVKWYPYKEKLFALKGTEPFSIFDEQAFLTGNIVLEPLGLVGDGLMDMKKARLKSNNYAFNAIDFKTDSASIEFDVINNDQIAFSSNSVKAFVSFDSRLGQFNKLKNSITAEISPMMYRSKLNKFDWAMDQNELTIATSDQLDVTDIEAFYTPKMIDKDTIPNGAFFFSYHADEDSLYFIAPKAKYNLEQLTINADSVKYILSADAIIQPHKQKLSVDSKKRIIPLRESKIIANYTNGYHKIYDAHISIPSRKKYYASGTIDYIDAFDSIQPIKLKEIGIDQNGNTFANANLTAPDKFKLSPYFGFIGKIELFAQNRYWTFDGGAQPLHSCSQIRSSNVKFKAQLQPDSIFIPIADPVQNLNQVNLITGSIVTVDSTHLYPGFLTGRKEYSDATLVKAEGYLHFNQNRNRYQIGSREKIIDPDTTGNLISLTNDFCILFSEGIVSIPVNLGQIKHVSTGLLTHNVVDSTLNMDLILSLDFLFNPLSLEAMANEIISQSGLSSVDINNKIYQKHINELVNKEEAANAISQIKLFGTMTQIPKELVSTISFSDLKMKWDHKNRSFVSNGKIGIGTIGNIQVNKKVDGFVEIIKRNTGDWMMIYIELSPEKYYVFYYVRGSLQVSSHNPLFTDPIEAMKNRDRRIKVKPGQIPYNFLVGTRRELQRARDRYAEILGIKTNEDDNSGLDAKDNTDIDNEGNSSEND